MVPMIIDFYNYGEIIYELTEDETDIEAFTSFVYNIASKFTDEQNIEPFTVLAYKKGRIVAKYIISVEPVARLSYQVVSPINYNELHDIEPLAGLDYSIFIPAIYTLSYSWEPVLSLDYEIISPMLEGYDYEPVTSISYSVA